MPKLYEVEVHYMAYVVAEDEAGAEEAGCLYAHEDDTPSATACEVTDAKNIDEAWRNALPYRARDIEDPDAPENETCLQAFERLNVEPPKPYHDPNQMYLPGYEGESDP